VCGYDWGRQSQTDIALVEALPDEFTAALGQANGGESIPELAWNAVAYVMHVADNLRIWGERLAGANDNGGQPLPVLAYDQDALAVVRSYPKTSKGSALWSLQWSVASWLDAVAAAQNAGSRLLHQEAGVLTVGEVISMNAHDAHHHLVDVRRILAAND